MVLLDSLYINNSGGKVLLDYLVEELEKSGIDVFYLFDKRCQNDFIEIPCNRKIYLNASLINRYKFYIENKEKFKKVFCFGNFPPPIKLNVDVYTYYHNVLILEIPKNYGLKQKIKSKLRRIYFLYLLKNAKSIIVQSEVVKKSFDNNYDQSNILILPFFKFIATEDNFSKSNNFLYVASYLPHKNHDNLFKAWLELSLIGYYPELHLTLHESDEITELFKRLRSENVKLINHGYLNNIQLVNLYRNSEFLIFPSLKESFGLPLIEASSYGCKVIASDLEYVYKVVEPSRTFNPHNVQSIVESVKKCFSEETHFTKQKVTNQINELINLLV